MVTPGETGWNKPFLILVFFILLLTGVSFFLWLPRGSEVSRDAGNVITGVWVYAASRPSLLSSAK
jgi:hypothetical protein